jgi:hypothetical protein
VAPIVIAALTFSEYYPTTRSAHCFGNMPPSKSAIHRF